VLCNEENPNPKGNNGDASVQMRQLRIKKIATLYWDT